MQFKQSPLPYDAHLKDPKHKKVKFILQMLSYILVFWVAYLIVKETPFYLTRKPFNYRVLNFHPGTSEDPFNTSSWAK